MGNNYRRKGSKETARKDYPTATGTVQMTREGYVFVEIPDDPQNDIFVKATKTRGALHGDTVKVAITREGGDNKRREGEIIEIVERSKRPFVGVLHVVGHQAWVLMQSKNMPYDISVEVLDVDGKPFSSKKEAEDHDGAVRLTEEKGEFTVVGVHETVDGKAQDMKAHNGMKVAAIVDSWPKGEANPKGHLVDVLGEMGQNDTEMHAILAEYGLPYRFEPEVENAADEISDKITKKDLEGRRDFRDTLTYTIDPSDAKDFDDALSFKKLDDGNYEIGVHIADVTYYVKPGGAVDKEAQARGTSVYLVDRTVPMLPEKLSNKLCSLRPNEDKLTFSVVFEITPEAKITDIWFGRTVIRSNYRFAYETAQQIIDNGRQSLEMELKGGTDGINASSDAAMGEGIYDGCVIPNELKEAILISWDLASKFRKARFANGAISFERPEMKVDVDENGKPIGVHQVITKEANWMIEEYMLLANKAVAEWVATGGKMDGKEKKDAKTFVYRVHDNPNAEKLQGVSEFAGNFGYKADLGGEGKDCAKALNGLLAEAKDKPEFQAIEMLALRSMAKACYSTDNIGHFGLAFKFYTHFTSPIRRYPDEMVHRLLALYLDGGKSADKEYYSQQCQYASDREVIAANAERDSVKYKTVEFMGDKIGNEYDGTISGLTEWGMYVEIEPTKIEGMVALRDIRSDYYQFDEEHYKIVGKRTGKTYSLGDPVRIKVKNTNLDQRILDYELIEPGVSEDTPRPEEDSYEDYGLKDPDRVIRKGNPAARKAKVHAAISSRKKSFGSRPTKKRK
jgi:ribonuclease R